jgi:transposase
MGAVGGPAWRGDRLDQGSAIFAGAMVIVRWACRKGVREGTWVHRMLGRKPRMLVAIALANKMARSIWAMLTMGEDYRGPVAAAF